MSLTRPQSAFSQSASRKKLKTAPDCYVNLSIKKSNITNVLNNRQQAFRESAPSDNDSLITEIGVTTPSFQTFTGIYQDLIAPPSRRIKKVNVTGILTNRLLAFQESAPSDRASLITEFGVTTPSFQTFAGFADIYPAVNTPTSIPTLPLNTFDDEVFGSSIKSTSTASNTIPSGFARGGGGGGV